MPQKISGFMSINVLSAYIIKVPLILQSAPESFQTSPPLLFYFIDVRLLDLSLCGCFDFSIFRQFKMLK